MSDTKNSYGWWSVDARENWTCPECHETSPADEWTECEPYCEDCGSHDGRACPRCDEQFDHVWGSVQIEDASKSAALRATAAHGEPTPAKGVE